MICMGDFSELRSKMEALVEERFPRKLSLTYIVKAAREYEMMLNNK